MYGIISYNYEIARRVKEINPAVLTIFGGPEPAITDPELFRQRTVYGYCDLF
jgi:hypothetical protein